MDKSVAYKSLAAQDLLEISEWKKKVENARIRKIHDGNSPSEKLSSEVSRMIYPAAVHDADTSRFLGSSERSLPSSLSSSSLPGPGNSQRMHTSRNNASTARPKSAQPSVSPLSALSASMNSTHSSHGAEGLKSSHSGITKKNFKFDERTMHHDGYGYGDADGDEGRAPISRQSQRHAQNNVTRDDISSLSFISKDSHASRFLNGSSSGMLGGSRSMHASKRMNHDQYHRRHAEASGTESDDPPLRFNDLEASIAERQTELEARPRQLARESVYFFNDPSKDAFASSPFKSNPSPLVPKKSQSRDGKKGHGQGQGQGQGQRLRPASATIGASKSRSGSRSARSESKEVYAPPLKGRAVTKPSAFSDRRKETIADEDSIALVQSPDRETFSSRVRTELAAHKLGEGLAASKGSILAEQSFVSEQAKSFRSPSPTRSKSFIPLHGNMSPLTFQAQLVSKLRGAR
eukprot:ANDGO_03857.mRNA.1 hypothetical protein